MLRFFIGGDLDSDSKGRSIYLSERNAVDLLSWLSFARETWGAIPAREVAARCRRRMWPLPRNVDAAIQERTEVCVGGAVKLVQLGREEGYLRKRTEELLYLAEQAGPDGHILFC